MVVLLAALVAVLLLQVLLFSSNPIVGLFWPALVASLCLSALFGSKKAAIALRFLLYALSAIPLVMLLSGAASLASFARSMAVAAYTLTVAIYLARSHAVARFYEPRPS